MIRSCSIRPVVKRAATLAALIGGLLWSAASASAQNVIEDPAAGPVVPATKLTPADVQRLVSFTTSSPLRPTNREAQRVAAKLDAHVTEFLAGYPWMPFHHTLGISGYETSFAHPDELFYALSLALPHLSPATANGVKALLARELKERPPFALEGYDRREARPREHYDVPDELRPADRAGARSAFGVYAFWCYVHAAGNERAAQEHWPAVRARVRFLLDAPYRFDPNRRDYRQDEAEALNGNLAALIATVRLAHTNADAATERRALARATELLELRVNLDRINPRILEPTSSTTKHLHVSKVARFCDLTPEIGEALRTLTGGCSAARLKAFREARPGWHLAFGDRFIGGENYTNPLHFSRALFAGAVHVEQLPPDTVARFIDVPWCQGDLFFIERCALALSAAE
jgi:hypothetical protein